MVYEEIIEIRFRLTFVGFKGYSNPHIDDCDDGGDFFLLYCFPMNKKIMATPSVMPKDVREIRPYYNSDK